VKTDEKPELDIKSLVFWGLKKKHKQLSKKCHHPKHCRVIYALDGEIMVYYKDEWTFHVDVDQKGVMHIKNRYKSVFRDGFVDLNISGVDPVKMLIKYANELTARCNKIYKEEREKLKNELKLK
jgi:hypothetical protein